MFGNQGGPGTQSQGRGPVATCIRGEKGVTCAGGILVLGGAWSLGEAGRAPAWWHRRRVAGTAKPASWVGDVGEQPAWSDGRLAEPRPGPFSTGSPSHHPSE